MASQSRGQDSQSRAELYRQAKLYNLRKCLFQSPFTTHASEEESDNWVGISSAFQVDMQVQAILTSSQKETHQDRLKKLKQELDYIKTDSWKYKPIEELIGF